MAVAALALGAVGSIELAGGEVLRAVQGDQRVPAQKAERCQPVGLVDLLEHRLEHRMEGASGVTGSSIARMWLSLGVRSMPNSVSQLDCPLPRRADAGA